MLGEACALLAALTWAVSLILFKRSEAVSPLAMNLFKNTVASALLCVTLVATQGGIDLERSADDWVRILISGVLGIAICDLLVFMALRRLGASLLAVVDCCYAPVIVACSLLVLGEEPGGWAFAAGAALVVGGVLLATTERAPTLEGAPPGRAAGVAMGVTGIVFMALGVVIVKPVLEDSSLVEVTLLRLLAGLGAQLLYAVLVPSQREALAVYRTRSVYKTLIPASVLGSYVAMLFWLGGFKWAPASVASVLNQLSAVFTMVLAWIFLGERLSGRRALGGLAAVAGAALILGTARAQRPPPPDVPPTTSPALPH
ncbi:MAG: DMT family transporter [Planctomycetota bacterium]